MTIAKTSLFLVQFPAGTKVCQIDDFPAGTARSRKGSVHVKPGTQKLTRPELDHITGEYGIKFRTLRKMAPPPPKGVGKKTKPKTSSQPERDKSRDKAKSKAGESPA